MAKENSLSRRMKRLLRKPKFLKVQHFLLDFQKFASISFVANSSDTGNNKENLGELFKIFANLAYKYFKKFLNWLSSWFPEISRNLVSLFRNHRFFILYGVSISLALLIFRQQVIRSSNSIMQWFKKKFPTLGCSVILLLIIYLLLMVVSDLPRLPIIKSVIYLISKVSTIFQNSVELGSDKPIKIISESRDLSEKNQFIFFSVMMVLSLRYLLVRFKRKVFDELPFGEILIEIYENDMENWQLVPT